MSPVWESGNKTYRIFKKGHTVHEQIATAIAEIAGDGNDDVEIDYRHVLRRVKFVKDGARDQDVRRTFYHNMSVSSLPELTDHNYWTEFLTEDNEGTASYPPVVPSSISKVFKTGFDANTNID